MKTTLIRILQIGGALLAVATVASAYSPTTPYRHVVTSEGRFFFVMRPADYETQGDEIVESKPAGGTAFKVRSNGTFKKMWLVEGWYEFPGDVLLSPDGKTMVRIREQFLMSDGTFTDDESKVVVAIYRKGKLLAGYTAKDLITDLKEGIRFDGWTGMKWVDRSVGFQPQIAPSQWHSIEEVTEREVTISIHPPVLQLTTLEGTAFLFDLKDGSILTRRAAQEEKHEESEVVDPFAEDDDPFKTDSTEDGTDEPATAPQLKSEGNDNPNPESKVFPQ